MTWNSKHSLCLAALLALACSSVEPRTQVMLVADADDSMRGMIASLKLDIAGSAAGGAAADATFSQTVDTHDPAGWPFRFALTPRNDQSTRRYKVTLSALDSTSKTIAVLRSECGFVKGKTLVLTLRFDARCVGEASLGCKPDETCADGKCGPASVDVDTLPAWSEDLPPTGTVEQPATAAGSGGASGSNGAAGRGGAGAGGMSGAGSIQTGVSDCGDGLVGPEERCDTAIAAGQPGACPSECKPQRCENVKLEGSGCQAQCTATPITAPLSEDGCCPPGADSSSDSDCEAQCGNGKVEKGETCDPPDSCPTLETCIPASPCLMAVIQGDAASCSATCTMQQIAQCLPGDRCCPAGCTKAEDSDCSNSCGDGVVDAARETCEPTNPSAQCRSNCDDSNACTFDLLTGSPNNCNVACTSFSISNPLSFDQCCPPGANANNDSDCKAVCGNGIVESGERCDGVCPDAAACDDRDVCTRDAVSGRDCARQCTHTALGPSTAGTDGCCPAGANATTDRDCQSVCGNGVVENGERCDGNCPSEASCNDNKPCTADVIMGSGCARQCVHNDIDPNRTAPDGCCPNGMSMDMDADCPPTAPMCGNGKVEAGEACDGNCPTEQTCRDTDPCTEDHVTGSPCHLECEHTPIGAKVSPADQCCPAGKDRWEDADCDPVCGNGHKEGNETCDGTDCPTEASCQDTNPCTDDGVMGAPCQAVCTHTPIAAKVSPADQCCPAGSDRWEDVDCDPRCGNMHMEPGETCDPPDGITCSATCKNIVHDPPPPTDGGLPP